MVVHLITLSAKVQKHKSDFNPRFQSLGISRLTVGGGWVVFDGGPETFLNWDSLQLDLTVKDLWVDEWWWPL